MIDIERFICSLMEQDKGAMHFGNIALKKQGFKYKDGAIVEIGSKKEPKFKKCDWVVYDGITYLITGVYKDGYSNDKQGFIPLNHQDEMRLWDVSKDAKDGDVLADDLGVILFRKIGNEKHKDVIDFYGNTNGRRFEKQEGFEYWGDVIGCALHPATKEQRDTLYKAMHDAGYEWDAEHKQLKEIEPKEEPTEFKRGYKKAIEDAREWLAWYTGDREVTLDSFDAEMEQKLKKLSQG